MKKSDTQSLEKPSVCPLDCADTCSLSIVVNGGRIEKVKGSNDNPFTRSKICAKVSTGLTRQVYGVDRLTRPLKRTAGRGPNATFEAISWPEALDIIYNQWTKKIQQYGAQSIVPMTYGGSVGLLAGLTMNQRFFNVLGARAVNNAPLCGGAFGTAYGSLFGGVGGIEHAELGHSRLIVIWANNITTCNLHLTKVIRDARKKGAKLVVIDPKSTHIAQEADLHLQVAPGTDVVLGYAVAAELNRLNALDQHFIDQHVLGAKAYLDEAKKYTLPQAANLCGVDIKDLKLFVQLWRNTKPVGMNIGIGAERNRNGGSGIRTALALLALTGNIGPKGAGVCNVSGFFPINARALLRDDLIDQKQDGISILDIPDLILNGDEVAPIKSVFIYNHNPIAVHPRQARMMKALSQDDLFVVGCDITLTDSMRYADVILPAASHLECRDLYAAYGHPYLQRSEPVIDPIGEALPNTEIFRRLAERFGFNALFPKEVIPSEVKKDGCEISKSVFTQTDEELIHEAIDLKHPAMVARDKNDLTIHQPLDCSVDGNGKSVPALFRGEHPQTPSGKIELFSEKLEEECGQGLPRFKALTRTLSFVLISPSSKNRTNSIFGNVEGHNSDVVLEMHPEDASERGFADQQDVVVFNEYGEVNITIKLTEKVKRGTLYTPKGAWLKGSRNTINVLIPGDKADLGGGACYNDTQVDIKANNLNQ